MEIILGRIKSRNLCLIIIALFVFIIITLIHKSDKNFCSKENFITKKQVPNHKEFYQSKDINLQENVKKFSHSIKTLINMLNLTINNELETFILAYNNSIETYNTSIENLNVYTFLPHLNPNTNSWYPLILHGGGRTSASIIFGIPTVQRQKNTYLMSTLVNLINNMDHNERKDSLIVVMIGETNNTYLQQITTEIKTRLPNEFESGLIDLIAPQSNFYPDFDKLQLTHGDTKERVRWRSKQNLDYALLMMYCWSKGSFYVQLEDDIIAKPHFQSIMKSKAQLKAIKKINWFILDFCRLGFIGKMFKNEDLPWLIKFIVMFYSEQPGDWLLEKLLETKICNLEKDSKDCQKRKDTIWIKINPSLFQHMGKMSSLNGKMQLLKDSNFKTNV
ncbi:alpha-1,3-mannosyl-glycoprotein 4-beta-N-acetylglucosaminyltransferase B-like [Daktulosphaira vitifoliae]|uniref:alpha-1,3-mannosyl-glycoprotein 4-beta-N-acetylglucosaminyltransferase B-like n=1 Tax=Daktulosphaira vitifoliae TaxID=58002 RepID=UPI0021AAE88D|nr:alpha-1,3-mannosyl-glycoprotein 4-beta-N-acetylglucosaminyltransferase B-like [Daktulosphaira vitifoliae]